ncbi:MAG: zincin-like metallopeptidase domain-containing protein, partial [Fusobacterium mortiferum]|nr:zincin-like metallopeptidase domain-containing protein [Fusobacterium mortiferum]
MSNAYDIVMDDRKKLVEKIIENMENGDLIFKKGWDVSVLRPQNPVSEVMYLGGNRLKLGIEAVINNYKDPRWVTYNQAKTNGWQVKKGEKGTRCEKWIFTKTIKEKDENGKIVEIEKKLDKPFPTYFTVFNAEQIEGIPPLELKNIDKEQSFIIAEKFIKSSECPIKEVAQEQAYYSPFDDEIVLPLRTAFRSEEAFLRTTLHEMGHSTGHKTRLNRDMSGAFGSENYAKEELVAELCSLFTQARLNIKLEGEHFNNHTAYLKSWIGALKNDPNELFRAATKAEAASERLYNNYLEKELLKEKNKKIEK